MISAVIITQNEARNIGRCLTSLQGVADEIIVLDSASTDATAEICRQHGVRFIPVVWQGYAATKNQGNALASHVYVLSLDADEALSPELRASILAVKPRLTGVYSFHRLAFYCGRPIRHGGWYPDTKLRLFPKDKACWQGDFVHETMVADADQVQHLLAGDLLHYTYYTTEEHVARARKYAALAAASMRGRGRTGLVLKWVCSPAWRFLQMYVLKAGFLDGRAGLQIAWITAREVAWKYGWALRGETR
jgi:glycosyltransferase involved in cell wall biosynthesis